MASTPCTPWPPSCFGTSAGKMRSVPFSPERRCTMRMTFTLSSSTPKRASRTSRRSVSEAGSGVNVSCVPDGTRLNFSSYSLPRWSRAKQSVGAAFSAPQRSAGHLPMRLYAKRPNSQIGLTGTCLWAKICISTWCEQYTGIRRHAHTDRTKQPMSEGYTRWTTSQVWAPRNHASFTPGLYPMRLLRLKGFTTAGMFGWSNEVSFDAS
mmetsp:Transcript_124854/g.347629  ORF Transcript_124854/g.347629 Transcript_124854/m.347629 type:complete len:208 (-) Transcript_124854:367-990(-)